ncbi:putative secreted protein [Wickerhamomyces ciferrii]|uniref:Secreted protein n=1 Tax=Wickerhamomyces ciferrii (strain ATCC 14091 / BCRC 22168 / CBS 111 / JCM 3599 / NBRC 0793 / NRRL Y-1031 F-60-10) TaxID=1206466 RepID=K0KL74_WICCF|nr:uncharacterized protein BN7_5582 [Wickerhamomyces ciferrii]CCH45995.1 putative secreted protein [Wickerhamomyces ciferrii]
MWAHFLVVLLLTRCLFGFSLNPSDPRSVTARVFDSQLSDLYEFIGDDEGFDFLKEDTKILDPGANEYQESELKLLLQKYDDPVVRQELNELSFESLEQQLEDLNDKLEALYQKLYNFATILVTLSDEDILDMADKLDQNPDYYEKVMSNDIDALSLFENWEPRKSYEDDYQVTISSLDSNYKEVSGVFIDENGKKYWDPDADYELF